MARPKASRVEMLPVQRRAAILDRLRQQRAASIQELTSELGASASTIRRDLEYLEESGYLERTHGGALLQRTELATFEPEPSIAAETAVAQKRAIGAAAAARLQPGQSVIFDSSSTVDAAARAVIAREIGITVVTNSLTIAQRFAGVPSAQLVVVGGSNRPGSATLTGEPGQTFLKSIHADVAFIGVHAITCPLLTETSLEVAAMKRQMIGAARRVMVLADSSKFTLPSFSTICEVNRIHEIVTDDGAPPPELVALRALDVACTVVPVAPSDPANEAAAGQGA